MLFEVPGLNLGEPKVALTKKKKKKPQPQPQPQPQLQPQKQKKNQVGQECDSSDAAASATTATSSSRSNKKAKVEKVGGVDSSVAARTKKQDSALHLATKAQNAKAQQAQSGETHRQVGQTVPPITATAATILPSVFNSQHKTKLQRKMEEKLRGARFRFLNQKLYESDSRSALQHFRENPEDFTNYHEGFKAQVASWPVNPVDLLIEALQADLKQRQKPKQQQQLATDKPTAWQVADMGCGEAKIMAHFAQDARIKVHSFDLAAARPGVIVADMTRVPLPAGSVDVVIFCLSLMNTNFLDALREARRILRPAAGGILRVAEVESRFEGGRPDGFIAAVESLGFKKTVLDTSHRVFWLFEFKTAPIPQDGCTKSVTLKPCLYKKR